MYIFLPKNGFSSEEIASFFSSCAPGTRIYVTCFALSYCIFQTCNSS